MPKKQLPPNTTLYPVPIVLITCGTGDNMNVFTLNRITSCNAEPPMISVSVRPSRASHDLIAQQGDFVVNIPWSDMELVADFVGSTTMPKTDKWVETGLTPVAATVIQAPLLAECPVNLECQVRQTVQLPSHSLFVAEVVAMHIDESILNEQEEASFDLAQTGLVYRTSVVRERPVDKFKPANLRQSVHVWRDGLS